MRNPLSKRSLVLLVGALALAGTALPGAFGQTIQSNAAAVGLTATLAESLTVAATPAAVTFTLASGATATASAPISIVTTWVLGASNTSIELDGYFAVPSTALTNGASTPFLIPTSAVFGQVTTGTPATFTPFTGTSASTSPVGVAGADLILFTQAITAANASGTRTDALNLEVDLTTLPQAPAGAYTGTITIQATSI